MAIERIVDTSDHEEDADEQIIEVTLRPRSFADYVGQDRLKKNLKLAIDAAKKRDEPLDHILLRKDDDGYRYR
jgi:Holliday junction DNA helicase RuvB